MPKTLFYSILLFILCPLLIQAQKTYSIKGVVKEAISGEPISYATVIIWNTTQGTATDSTGHFEISGVAPGSYRLQASFLGYKPTVTAEFRIANKDLFFPGRTQAGQRKPAGSKCRGLSFP